MADMWRWRNHTILSRVSACRRLSHLAFDLHLAGASGPPANRCLVYFGGLSGHRFASFVVCFRYVAVDGGSPTVVGKSQKQNPGSLPQIIPSSKQIVGPIAAVGQLGACDGACEHLSASPQHKHLCKGIAPWHNQLCKGIVTISLILT